VEEHKDVVHEHIKILAELESRCKSNTTRLNNMDKLVESVHDIVVQITKLVSNVEQQSKDLTIMVHTLERHEEKIDGIEDRMETKDTVSRLHGKIEELHTMVKERDKDKERERLELEKAKNKEFEDMKKFITKILIGSGLFVIGSLIVFAIVILIGMANAGALPVM